MRNLFISIFVFCTILSFGQVPAINREKSLSGARFDQPYSIQQTFDGYAAMGRSPSDNNVNNVQNEYNTSAVRFDPGDLSPGLLSFTAQQQNKTVLLSWSTIDEKDDDYFVVEKSNDGINFFPIGTINAITKSQPLNDYSFRDDSLVTGLLYYRLKQTNKSDRFVYSKIISLRIVSQVSMRIVPKPSAKGKFSVDLGEVKNNIYLIITDNDGRNVYSAQKLSAKYFKINLRDRKGIYYLLMVYDGGKAIQKLIVE